MAKRLDLLGHPDPQVENALESFAVERISDKRRGIVYLYRDDVARFCYDGLEPMTVYDIKKVYKLFRKLT